MSKLRRCGWCFLFGSGRGLDVNVVKGIKLIFNFCSLFIPSSTQQGLSLPKGGGTIGVSPFLVSRVVRVRGITGEWVGGTLLDFDRAAYVLGSVGSRPSHSTALAGSIL